MTEFNKIYQGDVLDILRSWPDEVVNCVVTSPPYWGLRDYGVTGQLGLEKTPEEYVAKMVDVFHEVWRVLRKDGSIFLNLGDSYAHNGACGGGSPDGERTSRTTDRLKQKKMNYKVPPGLKPKDLVGIPWMVAFALRADGWYLRSDIIWAKPNPMPESVTDRPTKAHEYLFLLSKSARYYYDAEAIKEPALEFSKMPDGRDTGPGSHGSFHRNGREKGKRTDKQRGHSRRHAGFNDRWDAMSKYQQYGAMRNKRSVWTVSTQPFSEAHFATFPPKLIEPCILAGCPSGGIVLDPFMGSGTTGMVAIKCGRKYLGIELNPEYVKMASQRIENEVGLLAQIT